jgi:cyclic beta-1,2-glucan synthetase
MLDDQVKQEREGSDVSQTYTPSTRTEQLQGLIARLSTSYNEVSRDKTGRIIRTARSRQNILGHNLALYESWLDEAHRYFRGITNQKEALTYASEWVLDNYYIIRQAIQQIEEDLPFGYFNQLPRLENSSYQGFPRIYAIARDILAYQHYLLDPIELESVLIQCQDNITLTMGELWALPIFLRYGLIEFLAQTLIEVIQPAIMPKLPILDPQLHRKELPFSETVTTNGDAANNNNIANIILSLRTISEQNWSDFFESISCLERTLRKDPAGIYPRMDFKTRDIYRKEIEVLSIATGLEESNLAEITIDLAGSTDHVGEFLLGKKRPILEQNIGFQPDFKTSFKRFIFRHATVVYLSAIFALTILILAAFFLAARLPELVRNIPLGSGEFQWDAALLIGGVPVQWIAAIILSMVLLIPGMTVSTSLINWLITLLIKPSMLPKLDFKDEIPETHATLITKKLIRW